MGEAKRKKQIQISNLQQITMACEKVSSALVRLATAASSNLGADCYLHAALGQKLLQELGFESQIKVGFAAWRVGVGDSDVISHTYKTQSYSPPGKQGIGVPFHAWLECDGLIVDFTTYQFIQKARDLDALDGGTTHVDWRPVFLVVPKTHLHTFHDVAQKSPKMAHYEENQDMFEKISAGFELDPFDLETALHLMGNESIQVFGPNQIDAPPWG